ncbi:MAG: STAS domain-containing protein [Acidimicrobiales bacterium]
MALVHASTDLTVDVDHTTTGAVVALDGIVDMSTAPELRATLLPLVVAGEALVLDLERVTFVDSTGLSVLVAAHRRSRVTGSRFVLANPSDELRQVLRMTHLDLVFAIDPPA